MDSTASRSASLAGFISAALLCPAAVAADLFVAGTIGEVYVGDSYNGNFRYFGGICLAPVQSLAIDDANVYAGDANGGILRLDLATGEFMDLFWVPNSDATDIVVHDQDLLVSSTPGTVDRVDPMTGTVKATLTSPIGIQSMHLVGDDLFVSGPTGSVYKGNPFTGDFAYFGCACSGFVQGLANDDTRLYAVDSFGQFVSYDLATGALMDEGSVPFAVTAMVMDGPDLLISDDQATVHRFNPQTHEELNTLVSPTPVDAMELPAPVLGDLDGDRLVGITDLFELFGGWGPCPLPPAECPADLDGDGLVGITDLFILFANWG